MVGDFLSKFISALAFAILLFIIAPMLIALRFDNIRQTLINDAVVEFVDNSRAAGQISYKDYTDMQRNISNAQPLCKVNVSYKSVYEYPEFDAANNVIGYKRHLTAYNEKDISKTLYETYKTTKNPTESCFELKEGGYLSVHVENTTPTLGTKMLKLFIPMYSGKDIMTNYGGYVGNTKQ